MLEQLAKSPCGQKVINEDKAIQDLLSEMRREAFYMKRKAELGSKKSRASDLAFEVYVNALLSNPSTHLINVVSNTAPLATRVLETAGEATSALIFRTAGERATYREAVAEAHGMAEGFVDAFRFLHKRFFGKSQVKTNESALQELGLPVEMAVQAKIELQQQGIQSDNFDIDSEILNRLIDYSGATVNTPGKFLSISDSFFKVINYRAEIAKQSMRKAVNESPENIQRAFLENKATALAGGDPSIVEKGLADADFRTYTNRPEGSINRWMSSAGHDVPGLRWIVPFRRTMVNIINYGVELTPGVNIVSSKTRRQLRAGGAERDAALGRMSVGFSFLVGAYSLLGDRMDGEAPVHPQARDLWQKDGHKKYTLRFAGENISMDAFGPFGIMLKAMAKYQQLASNIDTEADDDATHVLGEVSENLLVAISDIAFSEHWVESLAGFMKTISDMSRQDSIRPGLIFASKMVAGFIPSGIKQQITKRIDPEVKDITDPIGAFIAKIPWWSKSILAKIDFWGQPMTYDHFLDPSLASKITGKDPVSVELRKIGFRIPNARRSVGSGDAAVRMTPQEYQKYMIYSGQGVFGNPPLRDTLMNLMSSSLYSRFATDRGRAGYLRDAVLSYREAARDALREETQNAGFGKRLQERLDEKQQAMRIN